MRKQTIKESNKFQKDTTLVASIPILQVTTPSVKFIIAKPKEADTPMDDKFLGQSMKEVIANMKLVADSDISKPMVDIFLRGASHLVDSSDSFTRSDLNFFLASFAIPATTVTILFEAFVNCLIEQDKVKELPSCYSETLYQVTPYKFQV